MRIGINLGPARVVRDLNGNRNIIGDGINVAQRVMGFAAPNQILVSRSFYEVVSHISQEYAQLFQYAGLHRDKHIREHEFYEFQVVAAPGAALSSDVGGAGPDVAAEGGEPVVFSPELLARLTAALIDHLGPMANLIVRKVARRARDSRELLAAVANNLSDRRSPEILHGYRRSGAAAGHASHPGQRGGDRLGAPPRAGPSVARRRGRSRPRR